MRPFGPTPSIDVHVLIDLFPLKTNTPRALFHWKREALYASKKDTRNTRGASLPKVSGARGAAQRWASSILEANLNFADGISNSSSLPFQPQDFFDRVSIDS